MTRKKKVTSAAAITDEIRTELRSIIRQFMYFSKPIDSFDFDASRHEGHPRYYVNFDHSKHRSGTGLKIATKSITMPEERIQDAVLNLAKSVWHLKDRLHQWVRITRASADVNAWADACKHLLVCGDLANWKKHGRSENLSGLDPVLKEVTFDTSRSGRLEMLFDGATKEQELIVEYPVPITFSPGLSLHGHAAPVNAIEIIHNGFRHWVDLIQKIGVLGGGGRENAILRDTLFV